MNDGGAGDVGRRIVVGTAGFAYPDWKGVFYPAGLPRQRWLAYYAERFGYVELNTTFYGMPTAQRMAAFQAQVPEHFRFGVKAFQGLTHQRTDLAARCAEFAEACLPVREAGQLAAVLLQFPNSFRNRPENRDHLRTLADRLDGLPLVVEFRHREWVDDASAFELLSELGMGYVCVDEPRFKGLVPPVVRATAATGYVRFHGRNYRNWWRPRHRDERYDYLYRDGELREWLPRLRGLAAETKIVLAVLNNHRRGQAALNAQMLIDLLEDRAPRGEDGARRDGGEAGSAQLAGTVAPPR